MIPTPNGFFALPGQIGTIGKSSLQGRLSPAGSFLSTNSASIFAATLTLKAVRAGLLPLFDRDRRGSHDY